MTITYYHKSKIKANSRPHSIYYPRKPANSEDGLNCLYGVILFIILGNGIVSRT